MVVGVAVGVTVGVGVDVAVGVGVGPAENWNLPIRVNQEALLVTG